MRARVKDRVRVLLLLWLVGSITIGLQAFVGHATIYSKDLEAKRTELHRAILANQPPGGRSWDDAGALTLNVRIGVVYLAEGIHRITSLPLSIIYVLLDTVFLFVSLVALFFYLRKWLPDTYCLIGLLYFSSMLPLSYFLHHFHPYDRIQLAFWILLLYLIRERRRLLLGLGLAISMIIKFDTILLPGLYYAAHVTRHNWQRTSLECFGLFVVAICVYVMLGSFFPPAAGDPPRFHYWTAWYNVGQNIDKIISMNIAMPPLLLHGIPLILSGIHFRKRHRFLQASVLFAIALLIIYFLFSLIAEVRAQLMILVLVMPAALLTLRTLLDPDLRSSTAHSNAECA